MKYKYCKKGELYYLRLSHGYLRVEYIGIKDKQRIFHTVNGSTEYKLSLEEVSRLIARVPRQQGALKRLAENRKKQVAYQKFRSGFKVK